MDNNIVPRVTLIDYLVVIVKRIKFLILNTFIITSCAIIISLFLPKYYRAVTLIMPPQTENMGISSLIRNLPMSSLLGNSFLNVEDPEDIYIAILKSNTLRGAMINQFDLTKVYKFHKRSKFYMEDVFKMLDGNIFVDVTNEGIIEIMVEDRSPQRAAEMANFMVEELDQIYKKLSVEKAHHQRTFLEERLTLIKEGLRQCEEEMKDFQKENNMVLLDAQTRAAIEAGAKIEAQYQVVDLKLNIAKNVYPSGSAQIQELELELSEIKKQREQLVNERESEFFIPLKEAPDLGLNLARLERKLRIQEIIFELLTQEYERAKFEEAKNTPVVQVLDKPIVPQKKYRPKRFLIVISSFLLSIVEGLLLAFLFDLIHSIQKSKNEQYFQLLTMLKRIPLLGRYSSES